eukprot:1179786-Prorocentrum_minimum.AAC.4
MGRITREAGHYYLDRCRATAGMERLLPLLQQRLVRGCEGGLVRFRGGGGRRGRARRLQALHAGQTHSSSAVVRGRGGTPAGTLALLILAAQPSFCLTPARSRRASRPYAACLIAAQIVPRAYNTCVQHLRAARRLARDPPDPPRLKQCAASPVCEHTCQQEAERRPYLQEVVMEAEGSLEGRAGAVPQEGTRPAGGGAGGQLRGEAHAHTRLVRQVRLVGGSGRPHLHRGGREVASGAGRGGIPDPNRIWAGSEWGPNGVYAITHHLRTLWSCCKSI